MEQHNTANEVKTAKYTVTDRIFALLLLPIAYLCIRGFSENGFLYSLFVGRSTVGTLALAAATLMLGWCVGYLLCKGVKLKAIDYIYIFFCLVLAASFVLFTNAFAKWMCARFLMISCIYMLYACCCVGKRITEHLPVDITRAVVVTPFKYPFSLIGSLFVNGKNAAKAVIYVLAGLALAVFPTIMVALLLSFSNERFSEWIEKIFSSENFFMQLYYVTLAIIAALFMFAYAYGGVKNKDIDYDEKNERTINKLRFLPQITGLTALLPMSLLYIVHFALEGEKLFWGFSGVPENTPAAVSSAARDGFFALCLALSINLLMLSLVALFTKRGYRAYGFRIYSSIFSALNIFLTVTVMAKLILYIRSFGLTQLRLYAALFLVCSFIVSIILIVKQIFPKFKFFKASVIALSAMLLLFTYANIDVLIPKYNTEAFLAGKLDSIDAKPYVQCGESSVKYLEQLADEANYGNLSEEQKKMAENTAEAALRDLEELHEEEKEESSFIAKKFDRFVQTVECMWEDIFE